MPPPARLACYNAGWQLMAGLGAMAEEDAAPGAGASDGQSLEHTLSRYRSLAERTNNPMYVWLALQAIFWDGAFPGNVWPHERELSLPGWIAEYLSLTTHQLSSLATGRDFRIEPPPPTFHSTSNDPETVRAEYLQSDEFRRHCEAAHISSPDAMKAVPAALGLTRSGGWNAFDSLAATTNKMHEHNAYEAMKADGVPSKVALHAIGSEIGVSDASRLHARLREGKALSKAEDGNEVVKPGG